MARLRGPNGCPWDKEQTYQTITPYLLEEAHETVEAIDKNDFESLKEELGDLLMQIAFYCQMASEEKKFNAEDVIEKICEKLVRRHPHVFGEEKVTGSKEVLENWEKIKQVENKGKRESILDGIPKTIPAIIRAFRLGEKSSRVGFDWGDVKGIWDKVLEETKELEEAFDSDIVRRTSNIEHEYGDLLFTLANLGRFLNVDPETALRQASERFTKRFQHIEKKCRTQNKTLQSLSPKEWNEGWETAKKETL